MQDAMHDDDPTPPCTWCKKVVCECEAALACGIENPESCESCT